MTNNRFLPADIEEILLRDPGYKIAGDKLPARVGKPVELNYSKPHHKYSAISETTKLIISEADFQDTIIEAAHTFGWLVLVTGKARVRKDGIETYRTPYRADGAGFPDLFMIRDMDALSAEIKSDTGILSPEQFFWLESLENAGIPSYLWQPKDDWEAIVAILR